MATAKDNVESTDETEIKPLPTKVGESGGVTAKTIADYYHNTEATPNEKGISYGLNYEDVAEHFNVRVYDVRKVLDADFAPDPDVEAGIKDAD